MSKGEYLNQLHKYLRKLPRQDYEDAMEYFTEYFQETDEEGAEELMKELGTPKEAARELMANLLNKKIEAHQNYETDGQTRAEQKGSGKHVVWIALLVLFAAPVGAPLLAAFAAVVLALVVSGVSSVADFNFKSGKLQIILLQICNCLFIFYN